MYPTTSTNKKMIGTTQHRLHPDGFLFALGGVGGTCAGMGAGPAGIGTGGGITMFKPDFCLDD